MSLGYITLDDVKSLEDFKKIMPNTKVEPTPSQMTNVFSLIETHFDCEFVQMIMANGDQKAYFIIRKHE